MRDGNAYGLSAQTQAIEESLFQMAAYVEDLIARAIHAMTHADIQQASEVIATDRVVDDLRSNVRSRVLQTIEHWAPMGVALRKIISYQVIADELERIGDYAVHVARSARANYPHLTLELIGEMNEMARVVRQQVRDGVQALAQFNEQAAREVCSQDAVVDKHYKALVNSLQEYLREHPESVQEITQFLFTMHDMERIADRIANICEDVIYIITGNHEKLN